MADKLHIELNLVIPIFYKRANDKYGKTLQSYLVNTRNAISELAQYHIKNIKEMEDPQSVKLLNFEDNSEAEIKVASAILYEYAEGQSLEKITQVYRVYHTRRQT